jgi:hypothetical protein
MDIPQARTESTQEEMKAKMKSHDEKLKAIMKVGQENVEAMMEACLEKTEATDLGANPEESERQEVPKEEAAVVTIGALEDQYDDWHLSVEHHRQPKKRTQGDGESRKNLAAARRQMTRRAVPARRKGRSHKDPTVEKRRRKGPECNNGIRNRSASQQLRLRKERTSGRIFRKTVELEIEKRIVWPSTGLREVSDWTFRRSLPPPKRKKRRQNHNPRKRTKMMMVHLDRLALYQGNARDE